MKHWLVAAYKINESRRTIVNLSNQGFKYYLPKITTKKINSNPKENILFPGYIFIYSDLNKFSSIEYTKGIKGIIKFGKNIAYLTDTEIKSIKVIEEQARLKPIAHKIEIGQEVIIKNGSFKGNIVKIFSLPSKDRVNVLLHFLGSSRKINVLKKDLIF